MVKGRAFPTFGRVTLRTVRRVSPRGMIWFVGCIEIIAMTTRAVRGDWPRAALVTLCATKTVVAQRQRE